MRGPLEGVRVLDLTRVLAGPFCCMLLGDMGAEVVKVERTERGDDVRSLKPQVGGESLYFLVMNRNKLGITINFRHPRGPELLKDLVRHTDVLVENFRAGTMEKMGCGYDALKAINPRLVMASISGFGQDGPLSQDTCYDVIAQAMGGIMDMTGEPDGPPVMAGTFVVDYSTALYAVIGILGALRAREQTGLGQHVDVALLDTAVSYLITAIPEYLLFGRRIGRRGNRDRFCAPANLFRSKDGEWVYVAAATDTLFPQLLKVMGQEEVLQDPRFATNDARMAHVEEAEAVLAKWVGSKTAEDVVGMVRGAGLPCTKVASIEEVVGNPQVRHRGMLVEVEHPTAGRIPMHGLNIHFSHTPKEIRFPPPLLGQHNEDVYGRWLGLAPDRVAQLKSDGII
ncbi:MAG TPA: CoA transferase [Candidatus Methylomirabilis sp.]|nr:CoA transferase [Candidatus Methylomirabilis sp.]